MPGKKKTSNTCSPSQPNKRAKTEPLPSSSVSPAVTATPASIVEQTWLALDKSNWKHEISSSFTAAHKTDALALLAARQCTYGCQIKVINIDISNKAAYASFHLLTTEDEENERNVFKIDLRFWHYGVADDGAMEAYCETSMYEQSVADGTIEDGDSPEYDDAGYEAYLAQCYLEQKHWVHQLVQFHGFEFCEHLVRGPQNQSCSVDEEIADATEHGRMQGTVMMIQKGTNYMPICDDGLPGFDFSTSTAPPHHEHKLIAKADGSEDWYCDGTCGRKGKASEDRYRCEECDFDLCDECYGGTHKKVAAPQEETRGSKICTAASTLKQPW